MLTTILQKTSRMNSTSRFQVNAKKKDIPVPPDQEVPDPVEEPPDTPAQDPPAPVREPEPTPPRRLGRSH